MRYIIQGLIGKIKKGISKEEYLIALVVFLLVTLSFGLGWIGASRTVGRAPIIINCPSE